MAGYKTSVHLDWSRTQGQATFQVKQKNHTIVETPGYIFNSRSECEDGFRSELNGQTGVALADRRHKEHALRGVEGALVPDKVGAKIQLRDAMEAQRSSAFTLRAA
eukprot:7848916-Pyramimonas_sp.AAC.1